MCHMREDLLNLKAHKDFFIVPYNAPLLLFGFSLVYLELDFEQACVCSN